MLEHPSYSILDASKLSTYQDCPRRFFFRYMLGWEQDSPNVHLVFGKAVHKVMELVVREQEKGIKSEEQMYTLIEEATRVFVKIYRPEYPEATDQQYYPKVPGRIPDLIVDYLRNYKREEQREKVLYTEVAGSVPITKQSVMHFRIDAIREGENGVYVLEHKTGSRQGRTFEDKFYLSTQVGLYTHVLYALFPFDKVYGTIINGLIFLKGSTEFVRIPVRKKPVDMEMWLWETQEWARSVEDDMDRLSFVQEGADVMKAFRRNPESCTKYFGCPYLDYCQAWNNPLRRCEKPPVGFKVSWWDPREEESTANQIMNIGEKDEHVERDVEESRPIPVSTVQEDRRILHPDARYLRRGHSGTIFPVWTQVKKASYKKDKRKRKGFPILPALQRMLK